MKISLKITEKNRLPLLIIALTAIVSLSIFAVRSRKIDAVTESAESYTLVIDAGHGGIDGGAVGADGSRESDINLAIAQKLRAIAEFYALENTMVRQDDSTKSTAEEYSEHSDLVCRTEIVNAEHNPVLISIHQNSYPTGQPSGVQLIYAANDQSESFGKLTFTNLTASLEPDNRRVAEPSNGKLYILSHVNCPAILVECGFMSNFSDIGRLTDSDYQTAFSTVLLASYLQYKSGIINS